MEGICQNHSSVIPLLNQYLCPKYGFRLEQHQFALSICSINSTPKSRNKTFKQKFSEGLISLDFLWLMKRPKSRIGYSYVVIKINSHTLSYRDWVSICIFLFVDQSSYRKDTSLFEVKKPSAYFDRSVLLLETWLQWDPIPRKVFK